MFEKEYSKWLKRIEEIKKQCPDSAVLPSPPDARDYALSTSPLAAKITTNNAKLPYPPFVINQGAEPECVEATVAGIFNAFFHALGKMPEGGFSWSWLYAMCKKEDGIPNTPGTYIRVAMKIIQKHGLCPEKFCPSGKGVKNTVLTDTMMRQAAQYKIKAYYQLQGLEEIKNAIANGMYVAVGTMVTENNWKTNIDKNKGHLNKPDGTLLGGHATFLLSFDDYYKFADLIGYQEGQNSWGKEWANQGRYFMPYAYQKWPLSLDIPEWLTFMEAWAIEFHQPAPVTVEEKASISLWIGKDVATVEGKEIKLDVAPETKNSRTMVPLKFISDQLGIKVTWDEKEQRVDIYK
ncbi:stalk domain-containing protein [Clostridium formicaceticum]|uniref:Copper amine oxidase-like N-terminal domain-containing protein n=1 Tax=Clostridium formicaceticum TaxID=1497 RepID=A0AAC9RJC0_9CLOT|nr:stalk domain-containing protein [Clostridium formicaceticum]AOY76698.1 hypothetical protein BJL90_12970 [Clostridium formicaceticum]ARE87131.1 hypothetical protein CLFO_15170 [Clostridium formicaceticum]